MFQHLVEEIGRAEARGFGTDERAAEGETFAREDAVLVRTADLLIRAEEIADLSRAHAHVACGDVHVGTDVTVKLGHETIAETHDFGIGLACGVEVAAALAAAHGQPGKGIFESLLESEELHHRKSDVGLEAESAFVRPDCVVELHAEAAVDVIDALVVRPRDAEDDLPVRLHHPLQDAVVAQDFLVRRHGGSERTQHLAHGLHEFRFAGILAFGHFDDFGNIGHSLSPN